MRAFSLYRSARVRAAACPEEATLLHPAGKLSWLNEGIGYGVIARAPIPKGTITWVLDPLDQVLDDDRGMQLR